MGLQVVHAKPHSCPTSIIELFLLLLSAHGHHDASGTTMKCVPNISSPLEHALCIVIIKVLLVLLLAINNQLHIGPLRIWFGKLEHLWASSQFNGNGNMSLAIKMTT
jgi:hypothetical protein